MKKGDLYDLDGKIYMILDLFDRSWTLRSDDGEEQMRRAVAHISCMGSDGLEEFPLDWFCRKAEAIDE